MTAQPITDDIIGIGFGPANLSLAIALDGAMGAGATRPSMRFLERQKSFGWHRAMMLPGADMQISFVKDLVTLRDPTSPFSFINYLHEKGRLSAFLNLKTFNPSRVEYNDYLEWAAGQFACVTTYGETIQAVRPETHGGRLVAFAIDGVAASGERRQRRCRHLVLAAGGAPMIPEPFSALNGERRLIHSSHYLPGIAAALGEPRLEGEGPRIMVVGAGQSAVEIAVDAGRRYPRASVDLVIRGPALRPADDSPFVNEIFDPEAVDLIHDAPEAVRAELIASYRNTNYAVVDSDLLQQFYATLYDEGVSGQRRHRLLRSTRVEALDAAADSLCVDLHDDTNGTSERACYDAVICATGYTREPIPALLDPIRPFMEAESVDRHYRLPLREADPRLSLHLQGFAEASHGLTETLLSILPIRAAAIAETILAVENEARTALRPAAVGA